VDDLTCYRAKARRNIRSTADLWLLLRIATLATVLPLVLRSLPMQRVLKIMTTGACCSSYGGTHAISAAIKIARYVDFILNRRFWVYQPNCLKRALLIYHFLRRAGIDVHIYLGVKLQKPGTLPNDDPTMTGHAWLVLQGKPLLERRPERLIDYNVTYRFPARLATEVPHNAL
jgi:hypothetical protein